MAVDLAANALVTTAVAAAFAGLPEPSSAEEDAITTLVNRVSGFIEHEIQRKLVRKQWTNLRLQLPRGCDLTYGPAGLPSVPINIDQAITLTVDGVAQTVWTAEADGDQADFDVIVGTRLPGSEFAPDHFHRTGGWTGATYTPILLTYRGGFDPPSVTGGDYPIPERFQQAALEWVKELYLLETHGTQGLETITTPTGTFTKSARAVPPRVLQWLEKDRLVSV